MENKKPKQKRFNLSNYLDEIKQKQARNDLNNILALRKAKRIRAEMSAFIEQGGF